MKKKIRFKPLITLMATMIMIFAMSITVLADYNSANDVVKDLCTNGIVHSQLKNWVSTDSSKGDQSAVVDNTTFYWKSEDNSAIITAGNNVASTKQSKINDDRAIEDFSSVTAGFGLEADVATAGAALSGFTGALKVLMGAIVIMISIGMTVFSGFDLCYIAFPVFRNKCEDAKQSGSGMMVSNKKGANGESKLRFVSDDAQYAVVAADTTQSGKNPFVIYFSKHLLSYIVLAILLFIFLTGRVTVFTDIALRLVSGILNMLQGI